MKIINEIKNMIGIKTEFYMNINYVTVFLRLKFTGIKVSELTSEEISLAQDAIQRKILSLAEQIKKENPDEN